MITRAAAAVSSSSRRLPPLEPLSPARAPLAPRPHRIILWDEVGEIDPALNSKQHFELASLPAISHPERLAAAYGMGARNPQGS